MNYNFLMISFAADNNFYFFFFFVLFKILMMSVLAIILLGGHTKSLKFMHSREQAKNKSHHSPWIDAPHRYLMANVDILIVYFDSPSCDLNTSHENSKHFVS